MPIHPLPLLPARCVDAFWARCVAVFLTLCIAAFLTTAQSPAQGGRPFFVQDVNLTPTPKLRGSLPEFWAEVSGRVFFSAETTQTGREVFVSKGTAATTQILKDISKGPTSSRPQFLGKTSRLVFFLANDAVHGREIWVTDGSSSGTRLAVDTHPGIAGLPPLGLGVVGNLLFFQVQKAGKGIELWRTDGTKLGTKRLLSYQPNAAEQFASFSKVGKASKGILFFVRTQQAPKLFKTDGRPSGTTLVTQVQGLTLNASKLEVLGDGKHLFFPGFDQTKGMEVWISDGTAQGTKLLKDLYPGKFSGFPKSFRLWNGRVTFLSFDGKGARYGFYGSDGTPAGTKLLSPSGVRVEFVSIAGPVAVLYPPDLPSPSAPWLLSPGKPAVQAKLPLPSPVFYPPAFASPAGILLQTFGAKGARLWTANPKTGKALALVPWGPGLLRPEFLGLSTAGRTYLAGGSNLPTLLEPYVTDGSAKGTKLLKELNPSVGTNSFEPFAAFPLGRETQFFGQGLGLPLGLWSWKGLGTKLQKLQSFTETFVYPQRDFVRGCAEKAFAFTNGGRRLLRLNSKAPYGQVLLTGGRDDVKAGAPLETLMGGRLYFQFGTAQGQGYELYVSDGTVKGTRLLKDVAPGTDSSRLGHLATLGNRIFFSAWQKAKGEEPWVSDGTGKGTKLLVDLMPGTASSFPQSFVRWDHRVWFLAKTVQATGLFPHYTDAKGRFQSALFSKLLPNGLRRGQNTHMISTQSALFLWDGAGISSLFVIRKEASSYRISHLPLEPNGLFALSVLPLGDKALVLGSLRSKPEQAALWLSDGTLKGSKRLRNFGRDKSALLPLFRLGSRRALFRAEGQLWVSDGTKLGTQPLVKQPNFTNPRPLSLSGGLLHFAAFDPIHGREPWAWFPGAHGLPRGQGCGGTLLQTPSLAIQDPVLGNSIAAKIQAGPPKGLGLLLLGTPGKTPTALPQTTQLPCRLFLDLSKFWLPLPPFLTNAKGTWSQSFQLPSNPRLSGITVLLQGLFPQKGNTFQVTNAYEITLGN